METSGSMSGKCGGIFLGKVALQCPHISLFLRPGARSIILNVAKGSLHSSSLTWGMDSSHSPPGSMAMNSGRTSQQWQENRPLLPSYHCPPTMPLVIKYIFLNESRMLPWYTRFLWTFVFSFCFNFKAVSLHLETKSIKAPRSQRIQSWFCLLEVQHVLLQRKTMKCELSISLIFSHLRFNESISVPSRIRPWQMGFFFSVTITQKFRFKSRHRNDDSYTLRHLRVLLSFA